MQLIVARLLKYSWSTSHGKTTTQMLCAGLAAGVPDSKNADAFWTHPLSELAERPPAPAGMSPPEAGQPLSDASLQMLEAHENAHGASDSPVQHAPLQLCSCIGAHAGYVLMCPSGCHLQALFTVSLQCLTASAAFLLSDEGHSIHSSQYAHHLAA